MTTRKRQLEEEIARATAEIQQSQIPESEAGEITARVWQRLEGASTITAEAAEVEAIRGCDDYQKLIPAFLTGDLTPSRALLLEDHARQCVPCRRALKSARSGERAAASPASQRVNRARRGGFKWLAAAAVAVIAAGTGYMVWTSGPTLAFGAIVESTGAGLYRSATLQPIELGTELAVGERVLSAPGESSYLRLADGSRVEVRGRSELSIDARKGTTVRVERGDVIVEAAPQGRGRLYVSTDDCLVSVKGTIFAVSHGTKGSRVAVIEGEVQVDHAGREELLHAGDRTATYATSYAGGRLRDDFAWSRNVDDYLELVKEVTELRQVLARDLPRPELRYSSRLLDVAPEDMAFYAAFPNLVETLSEANRIVQERIVESPALSEWWNSQRNAGAQEHFDAFSGVLAQVGGFLGGEIVVTAGLGADGEMAGPLVLAELVDPVSLRAFLAEMPQEHGADKNIVFLEDAGPSTEGDSAVVWIGDDTMVAGPSAAAVRAAVSRIEGGAAATVGSFKQQLAGAYRSGAEILIGADVERLAQVAANDAGDEHETMRQMGLLDARHLILQQRRVGDRTENNAVLAFGGPRRGVAAWLAEPAPMGSLAYISPDAKLAAAVVLEQPKEIFDEMLAFASRGSDEGESPLEELERVEGELGVSLRDDVAAALGGEVAMALDGPLLPQPAWKVIAEVYDPDKLVWVMQQLLEAANDERAGEGKDRLEWVEEEVAGRTYYGFDGEDAFQMSFDEGYMVLGSSRAVIDRAIRFRQSGYTLATSSRFSSLLPADGNANFSALFYQDALALLKPLADKIAAGSLTESQTAALEEMRAQTEPTLAYVYAEEDRIVFAAGGVTDLLSAGLPALLGLGGDFALGGQGHGMMFRPGVGDDDRDQGNVATHAHGGRNPLRPAA